MKADRRIKILLVEDHLLIRNGIKLLLEQQKIFTPEIVEADNGFDAVKMAEEEDFDLILLDIEMPVMDGIEVARRVIRMKPDSKILALTMHSEDSIVHEMLSVGALGYLLKNVGVEELSKAILTVCDSKKYYSNEVAQILLNNVPVKRKPVYEEDAYEEESDTILSPREKEILKLVAKAYSNIEISEKLHINKRTVEGHKSRIKQKLNLKDTMSMIKYAHQHRLVK